MRSNYDHPLSIAMSAAVPLRIMDLQEMDPKLRWARIKKAVDSAQEVLKNTGEAILFKTNKEGDTADAFNAVAEAIAGMSFLPGGITIFGQHWESHGLEEPDYDAMAQEDGTDAHQG